MPAQKLTVVKFGGSSLADASMFKKVADIIFADPTRRYVIPSAPGKRNREDTKVTDMLYACHDGAAKGEDISTLFEAVRNRFRGIIADLGITLDLEGEFDRIYAALLSRHAGSDYAASRGEYLNGQILAAYLGYDFIDAAEVIFFTETGAFDAERTNEVLSERLANHPTAVIPGFYGSLPNGTVKTFSRGGSDVTGSIVARAAQADLYENWTDVSGCLMADPRVVDHPATIKTITYQELRELSYMGASVLHEDAIFPVRFAGIPINIRNTNDPSAPGTMIVSQAPISRRGMITGIAGKKGFSVVTIEKDMMNSEIGFVAKVLEVFAKVGCSVEHLPSGIDSISIVLSTAQLNKVKDRLINGICLAVNPECIAVEEGIALIAVVGRSMVNAHGTSARILSALAGAYVNVRMIDQGSSEMNVIIGVHEEDFEKAMRAIYTAFAPEHYEEVILRPSMTRLEEK